MAAANRPYVDLPASPDLPSIERDVLARWEQEGTFKASIEQREGDEAFVFYDGPPFANGLPHYGHLLTSFVKDAVPRYQTMKGKQVPRRFGWDCHGLPPEMEVEKELQLSGRAAIIDYGVDRFNADCAASVTRYTTEWQQYVTRAARWVDFADDYRTMDLPYMESVMWAFKTLHEKGLVYQGVRVLPYCWECETPLSNFETRQDDAYRDEQDPAVTVAFTLVEPPAWAGGRTTKVLAWTTTPWTLPSNLALAAGPAIEYAAVEHEAADGSTELLVLGASRLGAYAKELGDEPVVAHRLTGAELAGLAYVPLFPYFADQPNAFRVLTADYVADDDGTGVVHQAPGFGEDDMAVCKANGIGVVCPVDDRGAYTREVPDFVGVQVFAANRDIIRRLTAEGALLREDSYVHSVPHCWRTDTQLIYKAVSSWFVEVTAFRDRMVELNQEITWVPAHMRDGQFGKWIADARDWSISRNRFWGAPIPVWVSDDPAFPRTDVYGSLDDLERDFGVRPDDLHRPGIDALTRPNPDDPSGKATMRRVTDVLDCWFESGSMPFAQVHYPFENKTWFEEHFPADFIVEYNGQTRGWFYTLHVLGTALFDKPPFRSCVAHGIVLGSDGRKLSKRLRNYPDPLEAFERYGADAMRWSLLSSAALRGGNLIASEKQMGEALREAVLPLWNASSFLTTYANTASDGRTAAWRTDSDSVLDQYVLAKARELVEVAEAAYDVYDLAGACAAIGAFLEALTNWYVRRSRDRFWAVGADPDPAAVDTLFTVLHTVLRVAAPVLPLTTDHLWSVLRRDDDPTSVHLADWPEAASLAGDGWREVVRRMDLARDVCSAAHAVRKGHEPVLRTRLPLAALTVAHVDAAVLHGLEDLIGDEVNVKAVHLADSLTEAGEQVLTVDPKVAGPRLGKDIQVVLRAAKAGDWATGADGAVSVGGIPLQEGEYARRLVPKDPTTTRALPGDAGLVVLDTLVTPDLEAEGLARDVIRLVQSARKDAGLVVGQRIHLVLQPPTDAAAAAIEVHREAIAGEVLATSLELGPVSDGQVAELAGHGDLGIRITPA